MNLNMRIDAGPKNYNELKAFWQDYGYAPNGSFNDPPNVTQKLRECVEEWRQCGSCMRVSPYSTLEAKRATQHVDGEWTCSSNPEYGLQ